MPSCAWAILTTMQRTLPHPYTGAPPGRLVPGGTSPWQKAVGALGLVAVLWAGGNLYDAISRDAGDRGAGPPGGHGPGMNTPAENTPAETVERAPGAGNGGVHVPGPPAGGH